MSAARTAVHAKPANSSAHQAQACAPQKSPRKPRDPVISASDLRYEDPLDTTFLDEPELPGNHLFPEQLIRHLKERLRIATGENGRLRRALAIEEARTASGLEGAADGVPAAGGSNSLAAKQIVALAKRVRQLTAEGEATKRQLAELRRKESVLAESAPSGAVQSYDARSEKNDVGRRVEAPEQLQEQLTATKLRLCEARNQCQELKQRLQQANKALEDEVGAGAGDSRRGRAQQILALQRKVAQLQAQLQGQGGVADDLPRVRHDERERRAALDKMAAELERATQAQEAARLKGDAARARCKALEAENAAQRRRIETQAWEAEKDARIIEALKSEVTASCEREAARARELAAASQWRVQCEFLREELRRLQMGAVAESTHLEQGTKAVEPVVEKPPDSARTQASVEHLLRLTERLELRATQERRVAHEAQMELRREQVRSARMQARLAQQEAAGKAAAAGSRGYAQHRDSDKTNEAAQLQLELVREELLAAKAQLACVERDKQEDLKVFAATLQDALRASEESQSGQTVSQGRVENGQGTAEGGSQDSYTASPRSRKDFQRPSPRGSWLEMAALEKH